MAESYWSLSATDRAEALEVGAAQSGRPAHVLEKDVWVVWLISILFESKMAEHLTFKGGTSLSKAHRVVDRFSEDVDLTYDIRALLGRGDPPPHSRSQAEKLTRQVKELLPRRLADTALPLIEGALAQEDLEGTVRLIESSLIVEYLPVVPAYGYVRPKVLLEFGARATGEPCEEIRIYCDMAAELPGLDFPEALPRVLSLSRTFWEKATAAHVFCKKGIFRGERPSRHWYDLAAISRRGDFESKIVAGEAARLVAENKTAFFRENDAEGRTIDYYEAVSGKLQLIPEGDARELLELDFRAMIEGGMLPESTSSFPQLLAQCLEAEETANRIRSQIEATTTTGD